MHNIYKLTHSGRKCTFLVSKVVPTAFMLLCLPTMHQESSSFLSPPLLLLLLASGDMLPTAASVLSTLH